MLLLLDTYSLQYNRKLSAAFACIVVLSFGLNLYSVYLSFTIKDLNIRYKCPYTEHIIIVPYIILERYITLPQVFSTVEFNILLGICNIQEFIIRKLLFYL